MPKKAAPARVLIVDDDPNTQGLLSDVLVAEGYEVYVAPRVLDVRACFEAPPPDAVLLDLRLPDGNGMDLLPEMKQHWPETEVIIMTGFGTPGTALEAAKRGAFHFLCKPFDVEHLSMAVKKACEHKAERAPRDTAGP